MCFATASASQLSGGIHMFSTKQSSAHPTIASNHIWQREVTPISNDVTLRAGIPDTIWLLFSQHISLLALHLCC